jgi:CheY-like chemotaxis protein
LEGDCGAEERDDMMDGNSIWFRFPFEVFPPNDLGDISPISERSEHSHRSSTLERLVLKEDSVRSEKSSDVLSNKSYITASPLITANPTPSITTPLSSASVSLKADSWLRGLSILVVDDAVSIIKMISFILSKAGAKVTHAKYGLEAVEKTKETNFDIVITDIQMPVLDGFGAARGMREHERLSSSRAKIIIGISAAAEGNRCDDSCR